MYLCYILTRFQIPRLAIRTAAGRPFSPVAQSGQSMENSAATTVILNLAALQIYAILHR